MYVLLIILNIKLRVYNIKSMQYQQQQQQPQSSSMAIVIFNIESYSNTTNNNKKIENKNRLINLFKKKFLVKKLQLKEIQYC